MPCGAEESLEELPVARPGFEQDLPRDLPGGVPKREGNDDDVVERADHGHELGNEVDGREHPEPGESDRQFGSAGNPRISPKAPHGGDAGGQEASEVPENPLGQSRRQQHEGRPGQGDGNGGDEDEAEHGRDCKTAGPASPGRGRRRLLRVRGGRVRREPLSHRCPPRRQCLALAILLSSPHQTSRRGGVAIQEAIPGVEMLELVTEWMEGTRDVATSATGKEHPACRDGLASRPAPRDDRPGNPPR